MTTLTINLSDEDAAALQAQAQEEGVTLERLVSRRLTKPGESAENGQRGLDEAIEHIIELQRHVRPDPEGWTIKDYINLGRP